MSWTDQNVYWTFYCLCNCLECLFNCLRLRIYFPFPRLRPYRPLSSLLFKIEVKLTHDKYEKIDISKILSELSPEDSDLFSFSCKLDIPDAYLEQFRDSKSDESDNLLLSCASDLMETVFSDCLKLDKSEDLSDTMVAVGQHSDVGRKRSSSDISLSESAAKKVKSDKDISIVTCNSWSMFHLVWPRRKQVLNYRKSSLPFS